MKVAKVRKIRNDFYQHVMCSNVFIDHYYSVVSQSGFIIDFIFLDKLMHRCFSHIRYRMKYFKGLKTNTKAKMCSLWPSKACSKNIRPSRFFKTIAKIK